VYDYEICNEQEQKAFKQKVRDSSEIKIDDKGRVIRWKESHKADGIRKFLDSEE
jgi:hypothetical protein